MFIQTEDTPNPEALKFLPSREVLGDAQKGMADFTNAEAAAVSPLASSLFEIDGVKGVMLGRDFLTVTKRAQSDWAALKPQILAAIMDHFVVGNPVFVAGANVAELQTGGDEDDVVAQIPRHHRSARPSGRRARRRRHRFSQFQRRRGLSQPQRLVRRLPQRAHHAQTRRRKSAQALCAGSQKRQSNAPQIAPLKPRLS